MTDTTEHGREEGDNWEEIEELTSLPHMPVYLISTITSYASSIWGIGRSSNDTWRAFCSTKEGFYIELGISC